MIRQPIKYKEDLIIAVFIILASIFNIVETALPRPIPWLRLGLGNIFIISGIIFFGFKTGLIIGISKLIISSLFLGTIFSPAFFMGLTGTLLSIIIMSFTWKYLKNFFSVIGISMLGGVFHNIGQMVVILIIMNFSKALIIQFPIIIFFGTGAGFVIGLITVSFIKKWEAHFHAPPLTR